MLQAKNNVVPYIGVFKLPSGEEFIGRVTEDSVTHISVTKPLTVINTPNGPQFAPLMLMSDHEKPVAIPKPIIRAEAMDSVVSQYESITSGIALPQKQSILTAK